MIDSKFVSVLLGYPRVYCPKAKKWIDVTSHDGCASCPFFIGDSKTDKGIDVACSYDGEKKTLHAYFRCSCPKLSKWIFVNFGESSCANCEYLNKIRILKSRSETECLHPDANKGNVL